MKRISSVMLGLAVISLMACNNNTTNDNAITDSSTVDGTASYVDLTTGETVDVEVNAETKRATNKKTGQPIQFYVNATTHDTIYGINGLVVNGYLIRMPSGEWTLDTMRFRLDDDGSWVLKDSDTKIKSDEDGDMKIKDGDYKKKIEKDGDVKIKDGDTKIKVDKEEGKTKVKIEN